MTTAVISDIHGNAVALRKVLADIKERQIERIVCLGDIIGYGPEPLECIDLVAEHCEWSLLGKSRLCCVVRADELQSGSGCGSVLDARTIRCRAGRIQTSDAG